jgi:hypothetical protein
MFKTISFIEIVFGATRASRMTAAASWLGVQAEIATSPSAPRNDSVLLRVIASEAKQSRDTFAA